MHSIFQSTQPSFVKDWPPCNAVAQQGMREGASFCSISAPLLLHFNLLRHLGSFLYPLLPHFPFANSADVCARARCLSSPSSHINDVRGPRDLGWTRDEMLTFPLFFRCLSSHGRIREFVKTLPRETRVKMNDLRIMCTTL